MTALAPAIDNPLDSAIGQLRDICSGLELLESSIEAGSVKRMVVHITNINNSVLASTQDHINAAKRLKDFAFTLTRMASSADLSDDTLTSRMRSVAGELRAASEELTRSDAIPNWRAPAAIH